jgi:DNA adenine methylase
VGGKRQLLHRLLEFLPAASEIEKYHEPFAGAASLFFALQPKKAKLSDLNAHLIECYKQIRMDHIRVATYLREHQRRDSAGYYYQIRDLYNRSSAGAAQAARFIYLNRTCFNGVFRVNMQGEFNVPYGYKPKPLFPAKEELAAASKTLKRATLSAVAYETALLAVDRGEFAYVDPPYPPLNGTSYFTHYTSDRFSVEDQRTLASGLKALHERGGLFLLTNADLPIIRELYGDFNINELSVTRFVSCKGFHASWRRSRTRNSSVAEIDQPGSRCGSYRGACWTK